MNHFARKLMTLMLSILLLQTASLAQPKFEMAPFQNAALAGVLTDARLVELSGLAPAARKNRYWAVNDGGQAAILWQVDASGKIQDQSELLNDQGQALANVDFEDLASFKLGDKRYVAVGDIGDNAAVLPKHSIYIFEDQPKTMRRMRVAWTLHYQYPDRPHDGESLMVDAKNGLVYIVNKRVSPPTMYSIALRPQSDGVQVASIVGPLENLPVPDVNVDDESNRVRYASQPTGAVLGCKGNEFFLLTYASVFRYRKIPNKNWTESLKGQFPQVLGLPPMIQAEAVTMSKDCQTLIVSGEKIPGAIWHYKRRSGP
jgi:hypothetical protein